MVLDKGGVNHSASKRIQFRSMQSAFIAAPMHMPVTEKAGKGQIHGSGLKIFGVI